MNKERLLLLADRLEQPMPINFSIKEWWTELMGELAKELFSVDDRNEGYTMPLDKVPKHTCGYAACAIGYAMLLPEFQEQGFMTEGKCPMYEDETGWNAVETFFDLSFIESTWLFSGKQYVLRSQLPDEDSEEAAEDDDAIENALTQAMKAVTPQTVAQRIREFVDADGWFDNSEFTPVF